MFSYSKHEQDLIELILGLKDGSDRKSTLQLVLENARFHCGMEIVGDINNAEFTCRQNITERVCNGDVLNHYISDEADIFTSILSYLIGLEQIGTLFYTEDKMNEGESNGIINAIKIFSKDPLTREKRIALKNLRNSLGHAYGLVNVDRSKNKGTHKFSLNFKDDSEEIIKVPNEQNMWDGNYLDKKEETSTVVYAFPLIRFVEEIIQNVINEYHNVNLRFIFFEEIKSRFTIRVD